METNKMFVFNEDGVAEYVIAKNKNSAINYIISQWGHQCWEEYRSEFMDNNQAYQEFVDNFVREMKDEEKFTLEIESDDTITRTVREHIEREEKDNSIVSPVYFAWSN